MGVGCTRSVCMVRRCEVGVTVGVVEGNGEETTTAEHAERPGRNYTWLLADFADRNPIFSLFLSLVVKGNRERRRVPGMVSSRWQPAAAEAIGTRIGSRIARDSLLFLSEPSAPDRHVIIQGHSARLRPLRQFYASLLHASELGSPEIPSAPRVLSREIISSCLLYTSYIRAHADVPTTCAAQAYSFVRTSITPAMSRFLFSKLIDRGVHPAPRGKVSSRESLVNLSFLLAAFLNKSKIERSRGF